MVHTVRSVSVLYVTEPIFDLVRGYNVTSGNFVPELLVVLSEECDITIKYVHILRILVIL